MDEESDGSADLIDFAPGLRPTFAGDVVLIVARGADLDLPILEGRLGLTLLRVVIVPKLVAVFNGADLRFFLRSIVMDVGTGSLCSSMLYASRSPSRDSVR